MTTNGYFYEGGKVGRSDAPSIILFSADFHDLKSLSFKFCNVTFITFEIPRVSYNRPDRKIFILLLFCSSVIRSPCSSIDHRDPEQMEPKVISLTPSESVKLVVLLHNST